MENLTLLNGQLELSLKAPVASRSTIRRSSRAQWWFRHMREVVDHAINHPPRRQTAPDFPGFPASSR
ncbi:MAG TPA: hypothetical protein VN578_20815 [Candidatus Binatia bacterium]|jgi:hypothetical protein|nr:hypothetical protein [Candidatus Binatia bacterium]